VNAVPHEPAPTTRKRTGRSYRFPSGRSPCDSGFVAFFFFVLLMFGFATAGVLSVIVRSDNPRVVGLGRTMFAFVPGAALLIAAGVFSVANTGANNELTATRSIWWLTVVAGGIPFAAIAGIAVRRGYAGRRRLELALALLVTAALFFAFPLGFIPGPPLTGLGLWEHTHHALDVVVLLVPTLILLGAEVLRGREQTDAPTLVALVRSVPRRWVVTTLIVVLVGLWFAGAGNSAVFIGLAVLIVGGWLIAAVKSRSAVRRIRRDIGS